MDADIHERVARDIASADFWFEIGTRTDVEFGVVVGPLAEILRREYGAAFDKRISCVDAQHDLIASLKTKLARAREALDRLGRLPVTFLHTTRSVILQGMDWDFIGEVREALKEIGE